MTAPAGPSTELAILVCWPLSAVGVRANGLTDSHPLAGRRARSRRRRESERSRCRREARNKRRLSDRPKPSTSCRRRSAAGEHPDGALVLLDVDLSTRQAVGEDALGHFRRVPMAHRCGTLCEPWPSCGPSSRCRDHVSRPGHHQPFQELHIITIAGLLFLRPVRV